VLLDQNPFLTHRSIWRPLIEKVKDVPLAFCDARSVRRRDLVAVDKVHSDHLEEGWYMKYHPEQQWYYLAQQTHDEVAIFVSWDSECEERFGKRRKNFLLLSLSQSDWT
jgi:hypothetical protein